MSRSLAQKLRSYFTERYPGRTKSCVPKARHLAVEPLEQRQLLAVWTVDDSGGADFSTIQDAIDAASSGDTINVAAGTYREDFTLDKAIALLGPNDTGSPNGGARVAEAIVEIDTGTLGSFVTADGASVKGFTFQAPADYTTAGTLLLIDGADDVTVEKNIFDTTLSTTTGSGISCLWSSLSSGMTITDNRFLTNGGSLGGNADAGMDLYGGGSAAKHNTISDNVLVHDDPTGGYGLAISSDSGQASYYDVTGNSMEQYNSGIQLIDYTATAGHGVSDVTLSGNTVTDGKYGMWFYGIAGDATGISNVTVGNTTSGNSITGNEVGIKFQSGATNIDVSTITVNYNNISGNTTYGIDNPLAATLDAQNNWWGDATGPDDDGGVINGTGDAISTNVDAYHWLFEPPATRGSGIFVDAGQRLGDSITADIALADFDDDGYLDLFSANYGPNNIWLNDGTGNFGSAPIQSLGNSDSTAVALGDFNSDGFPDAIVGNVTGTPNEVWLNNTDGTFTKSLQELGDHQTWDIAVADLNSDGNLDVFVANGTNQPNKVWLGDGNGGFTDTGQLLGNSHSVAVSLGDIDNDGDVDAFVANHDSQHKAVWKNDGQGNFSLWQTIAGPSSTAVSLADFDGDGNIDAVIGNLETSTIWSNDGTGTFTDTGIVTGDAPASDVAVGPLLFNGKLDIFQVRLGPPHEVYLAEADGLDDVRFAFGSNSASTSVSLGDLDLDGDLDAVIGNVGSNTVWLNGIDMGDAPDPYPTLASADGPRHNTGGPRLGAEVDADTDGQPDPLALGDDQDLLDPLMIDDEDGVTFTSLVKAGQTVTLDVEVSQDARLDAWFDFNADGDWIDLLDGNTVPEQIFANFALTAGTNHLSFAVPAEAVAGTFTYARFRVSTAGGLDLTGFAPDGEVEDYAVWLGDPGVVIYESGDSTSVREADPPGPNDPADQSDRDTYMIAPTAQPGDGDPTDLLRVYVIHDGGQLSFPGLATETTAGPYFDRPYVDFTGDDWAPKTVTVEAVDNDIPEAPHTGLITHATMNEDAGNYDGVVVSPDVLVGITDDGDYGISAVNEGVVSVFGGVDSNFTFTNDNLEYTIDLDGNVETFPAADVHTVVFHGGGGTDTVLVNGTADNETAELWVDHGQFVDASGVAVTVQFENVESIEVKMDGGFDKATFHDSEYDDFFIARLYNSTAMMTGFGIGRSLLAGGVEEIEALAEAGGYDSARLYDSFGNDTYVGGMPSGGTQFSRMKSRNFVPGVSGLMAYARSFENAYGIARVGNDTATLYDTSQDDVAWGDLGRRWTAVFEDNDHDYKFDGNEYFNKAKGFDTVTVHASTSVTRDVAMIFDTTGNDTFTTIPRSALMQGSGRSIQVDSFDYIHGYGRAGGNDTAVLWGSPGDDNLEAQGHSKRPWAILKNEDGVNDFYARAKLFDEVIVEAASGTDVANFYDSTLRDTLTSWPEAVQLEGEGFSHRANNFDKVYASSRNGGNDVAILNGSDFYVDHLKAEFHSTALNNYVEVGPGAGSALDYLHRFTNFDEVHAYGEDDDTTDITAAVDWLILHGWG